MENITSINCLTEEQTRELVELERYPPRVTYTVDGVSASGSMERKILIRGTGGEEGELAFCLSLRNTGMRSSLTVKLKALITPCCGKLSTPTSPSGLIPPNDTCYAIHFCTMNI